MNARMLSMSVVESVVVVSVTAILAFDLCLVMRIALDIALALSHVHPALGVACIPLASIGMTWLVMVLSVHAFRIANLAAAALDECERLSRTKLPTARVCHRARSRR